MQNSIKILSSMKKLWQPLLSTLYFAEHSELLHVIVTNIINICLFSSGETKVYGTQVNNLGYTGLNSRHGIQTLVYLAVLNS